MSELHSRPLSRSVVAYPLHGLYSFRMKPMHIYEAHGPFKDVACRFSGICLCRRDLSRGLVQGGKRVPHRQGQGEKDLRFVYGGRYSGLTE